MKNNKKFGTNNYKEKLFPALMSEKSLAKDWNNKGEDKAWKKLKSKK